MAAAGSRNGRYPRRSAAAPDFPVKADIGPVLRHAGWFGFFLVLAPVIGPRGYGLFILALSGVLIAEALLSKTTTAALVALPAVDARHLSTGFVATAVAGAALSATLYGAARMFGAMADEALLGDLFGSLSLLPMLGALAIVPRGMLLREHRHAPPVAAEAAAVAWRPCIGAGAAALLLRFLAEPVGLALDPAPALALTIAAAWLCYLVLRGNPGGAAAPMPPLPRRPHPVQDPEAAAVGFPRSRRRVAARCKILGARAGIC